MTDETTTAVANRCYRHPDRESFVRCQRCGRTICGQCQTLAAVGVHCPECVREARASAPRVKPRVVTAFGRSSTAPVVTYIIMGLVAIASLLAMLPKIGGAIGAELAIDGSGLLVAPWSVITHVLVNRGGILNIAIGLFALFWFGRLLEGAIGRVRYLVFVVLTALGGAAAFVIAELINPTFTNASGTVGLTTGLLVGVFVIQRHLGTDNWYLLLFVAVNIGYNLFAGGSWESLVGGAITAFVTSIILVRTRRISRATLQVVLLVGLGVILLAICTVAPLVTISVVS